MKKSLVRKGLVLGIIVLFVGASVIPSTVGINEKIKDLKEITTPFKNFNPYGTTWYVDDDNTEGPWDGSMEHPYQYIQDGIDAATDGDEVYVFNGTYDENVEVYISINLVGEIREDTIIDAGGEDGVAVSVVVDDVSIDSFTMRNGEFGVYLSFSLNNNITNCDFYDNSNYGIYFDYSPNNKLRDNTIDAFSFTGSISDYEQDIDTSNTINGKPICYLVGQSNVDIDETSNCGYLGLISCDNITAENLDVQTILMVNTSYSMITDVVVHDGDGISSDGSNNNIFTNCDSYGSSKSGIGVGSYNELINCNAYDNLNGGIGIGDHNIVTNCKAYDNFQTAPIHGLGGFGIGNSNTLTNCVAYNNSRTGFKMYQKTGNTFINCVSYNNSGTYLFDSCGFVVEESPNNDFINCTVYNNTQAGFWITWNGGQNIVNCTVYDNLGPGIRLQAAASDIIGCTIYGNSGSGFQTGMTSYDINVKNCTIYNNSGTGIDYYDARFSSIENCTVYNNNIGIFLYWSDGVKMRNTAMYNNNYNFCSYINGEHLADPYDIDDSVTIEGRPTVFLVGQSDMVIDETTYGGDVGYIGLISCTNITVKNIETYGALIGLTTHSTFSNVVSHNGGVAFHITGSYYVGSSYNTLVDCTAYDCNMYGFLINPWSKYNTITNCVAYDNAPDTGTYNGWGFGSREGSSDNDFTNCVSYGNNYGFMIMPYSDNSNFINCTAYNNTAAGLYLWANDYCNIINSTFCNNGGCGIDIYRNCYGNNVIGCNVHNNGGRGIFIHYNSNGHLIYHNNFINNAMENAYDECSNTWDDGYPSGGNYWDDYTGIDSDGDGIGDTPYPIPGGDNEDRYPLMSPWSGSQPDLECDGTLSWTDVQPGATVTGEITVENIGDPGSELDWTVIEYPGWGTWTFTPMSGNDLKPEDGIFTIDVEVIAPNQQEQNFTGQIKIVNIHNTSDFCIIDVSLATPVSQFQNNQQIPRFMQSIIERYPILRQVLGL